MSQGMPNDSDLVNFRVVSEEEYRVNLQRAEEAQAQLDHFRAMNEAAKKAYDKQQELLRKIQEGKEAEYGFYSSDMGIADQIFRRQLQSLKGTSGSAQVESYYVHGLVLIHVLGRSLWLALQDKQTLLPRVGGILQMPTRNR